MPVSISRWILSYCSWLTTGPRSVSVDAGSPTLCASAAPWRSQRLVVAIGGHQHAGRRVAGLAAVAEAALHALRHRRLEIGVRQHDVGRLAAEFLGDALDGIGRRLGDDDAGPSRAGERHHVDIGVAGHDLADIGAVAVDEVEHALGHAGVVHHLGEDEPLIGAISLGFSTIVQPAASAGATLQTIWLSGQFHGVIRAHTPIGSCTTMRGAALLVEFIRFERVDRRLQMGATAQACASRAT